VQALRNAILVSAAVIGVAGFAGSIAAQNSNVHVIAIHLPDGSVEQIRYIGDQPPQVSVDQDGESSAFAPQFGPFEAEPAFADLVRMSAEMDREATAMLRQVRSLSANGVAPDGFASADFGKLPPGAQGYSVVSTMSGGKVCTHTAQYFAGSNGKVPRVLTQTSGDCGRDHAGPLHARTPQPAKPVKNPALIEARYNPDSNGGTRGKHMIRIASIPQE
jgi:hypothetical protein